MAGLVRITGAQVRAARALVRLEQKELADLASVSVETVKRLEKADGPISTRLDTLEALHRALASKGIEFIDQNGGGPGVRLKEPRS